MEFTGKMLLINMLNIVYLKFFQNFELLNLHFRFGKYILCVLNDSKIYNVFLRIYMNKYETSKLNSQETAQNSEKHIE
jgi:hypothetical protein